MFIASVRVSFTCSSQNVTAFLELSSRFGSGSSSVGCSTGHSRLQGETLKHECITFLSPKKPLKTWQQKINVKLYPVALLILKHAMLCAEILANTTTRA